MDGQSREREGDQRERARVSEEEAAAVSEDLTRASCDRLLISASLFVSARARCLQVLFFYPLDFTFVCPTEIRAFSDRYAEFEKLGVSVVAASVDSEFSHLAWTQQPKENGGLGPMKIPILSDITKNISRNYGVLLEEQGVALRGLFIIDPKGVLRQSTVNDLPIGRSVDETLRLVQAFQFHEKNGDVCPAGWTPGKESMTADPAGLKKYFARK